MRWFLTVIGEEGLTVACCFKGVVPSQWKGRVRERESLLAAAEGQEAVHSLVGGQGDRGGTGSRARL